MLNDRNIMSAAYIMRLPRLAVLANECSTYYSRILTLTLAPDDDDDDDCDENFLN